MEFFLLFYITGKIKKKKSALAESVGFVLIVLKFCLQNYVEGKSKEKKIENRAIFNWLFRDSFEKNALVLYKIMKK